MWNLMLMEKGIDDGSWSHVWLSFHLQMILVYEPYAQLWNIRKKIYTILKQKPKLEGNELNSKVVPTNSLNEEGMDLFSLTQNTSLLCEPYRPGSTIMGLALSFLQVQQMISLRKHPYCMSRKKHNIRRSLKTLNFVEHTVERICLLFPTHITCVLNKVKVPWQVRENMNKICSRWENKGMMSKPMDEKKVVPISLKVS